MILVLAPPAAGNFTLLPKGNQSKEGGKSRDNCAHAKVEAYKPKQSTQEAKGQVVAHVQIRQFSSPIKPKTQGDKIACLIFAHLHRHQLLAPTKPNHSNRGGGGDHETVAHMYSQQFADFANPVH